MSPQDVACPTCDAAPGERCYALGTSARQWAWHGRRCQAGLDAKDADG